MSDTTFVARVTNIVSGWLNAVNNAVFRGRNQLYTLAGGTAAAYTLTLPAPSLYSAYAAGDRFSWLAGNDCEAGATLALIGQSTLAGKPLFLMGEAVVAGQIATGDIVEVIYTSDDTFEIVGGGSYGRFVPASAAALPRSISSKLMDIVSAKDFCEVVDGIADNTSEIQAGLDAVGSMYFSPDVYMASGLRPGAATVGNCYLFGDGPRSTIIRAYSGTDPVINIDYLVFNVTFKDLGVDGNAIATESIFIEQTGGGVSAFVLFDNVNTYGATDHCTWLSSVSYAVMVQSQFTPPEGGTGLRLSNVGSTRINTCQLSAFLALDTTGIVMDSNANGQCSLIFITDTDLHDFTKTFIKGTDAAHVVLTRCTFENESTTTEPLIQIKTPNVAMQTNDWTFRDCNWIGRNFYTQDLIYIEDLVTKVLFDNCRAIVPGGGGVIINNNATAYGARVRTNNCWAMTGYFDTDETPWSSDNCTTAAGAVTIFDFVDQGTWTPSILFGGLNTGMNYALQNGLWRRRGDVITVWVYILFNNIGSATGAATVNMPFTSADTPPQIGSGNSVSTYNNMQGLTGIPVVVLNNNTDTANLVQSTATEASSITEANFTNTSLIAFSFSYLLP